MILALIALLWCAGRTGPSPNMKKLMHIVDQPPGVRDSRDLQLYPGGVGGATFVMLAHGISTGGLFILAGICMNGGTLTRFLNSADWQLHAGIRRVFLFVVLASVGLPLLNGFVGEFLVLSGALRHARCTAFWELPGGLERRYCYGCISECFWKDHTRRQ